jgi:isopentenyl-diphosphate Delta-isomerase
MTGPANQILAHGPEPVAVDVLHAHRPPGILHLAISVQLVDRAGNWLVQQRAASKRLFAGRWANSCCTHPRPDESPADAARRCIRQELGIDAPDLDEAGQFTYRAADPASGLVEHEVDRVLVGRLAEEGDITPNPAEVAAFGWFPFDRAASLVTGPQGAPWAGTVLDLARRWLAAAG